MSDNPRTYTDKLEIKPLDRPPNATIRVPGSKSITNRALVMAALTEPQSGGWRTVLSGALRSEDTEVMIACLRTLGIDVAEDWHSHRLTVEHVSRSNWSRSADFYCGNSGTTIRFLTAAVSAGHGHFRLDGTPRMRERPIQDLVDALRQLGVTARCENDDGCPPVIVDANGLRGGTVRVRGEKSSQFLSGLMMVAPLADSRVKLVVEGELVSQPYVEMTRSLMCQFGPCVTKKSDRRFDFPTSRQYEPREHPIEPDASAASYFFGAAAIARGTITLQGLSVGWSIQGDVRLVHDLESMGCKLLGDECLTDTTIQGGPLHGIDVDMNDISDTVMTLAAVACFAEGPTTIRNVAHIRHKETDRLAALATELRRLGAEVDEFADGLTITPRPLHGAEVETYNDHRMAMSLALIGLKVPGVVIKNPGCVAKTYPGFWDDLEELRS